MMLSGFAGSSLLWLQNLYSSFIQILRAKVELGCQTPIYHASASHVSHKGICLAHGATMVDLPYLFPHMYRERRS
jgi:hypothetical protein